MLSLLLTFLALLWSHSLWALDPDKFTVCAMTLNSTNERNVFEQQVKKFPDKFNPIVELTSFSQGKEDWFEKACDSGIKCDQVLISGHFAAGFSGTNGSIKKKLNMKPLERAGCSNTCEGILDHPFEVFLMGCNTLATKAVDKRGPEKYLDVLVNDDHIPYVTASFIVEGRYGKTGDDNKTRVERAFRGQTKQLYGFDSVGPSGKTVERMLQDYFSRTSLLAGLQKAQAVRFTDQLNYVNQNLAKSLSLTDFEQCTGGSDDPKDKRICTILDEKIPMARRLDAIHAAMASEDWVKYIPTINDFFKKHPAEKLPANLRFEVDDLSKNKVIKSQVKGLVNSTSNIAVQLEWMKFAKNFKYLSQEEESAALTATINRLMAQGIDPHETNFICSNMNFIAPRFNGGSAPSCLSASATPTPAKAKPAKPARDPLAPL